MITARLLLTPALTSRRVSAATLGGETPTPVEFFHNVNATRATLDLPGNRQDFPMSERSPTASIARQQRLRLRRVGWASISYVISCLVGAFCHGLGVLEAPHVAVYVGMSLAINLGFVTLIRSGLNLRAQDPSLTAPQIVASLAPALYAFYHVDAALARGALLIMALVSLLYGLLSLDKRRIAGLGLVTVAGYGGTLAAVHREAGWMTVPPLEALLLIAVGAVITQLAWIGGYVAELRVSLKNRNAELHDLATRDPLTRLANRRSLMSYLDGEVSRKERRSSGTRTLSLCLIDLDLFKQINDRYGHQTGDAVLQRVAETISAALRRVDFAGRFGGEEFLLVLPETALEGAAAMAERLREAFRALRIDGMPADHPVTASFGVTEHVGGEPLHAALRRADDALYEAKHRGRDRVITKAAPVSIAAV